MRDYSQDIMDYLWDNQDILKEILKELQSIPLKKSRFGIDIYNYTVDDFSEALIWYILDNKWYNINAITNDNKLCELFHWYEIEYIKLR